MIYRNAADILQEADRRRMRRSLAGATAKSPSTCELVRPSSRMRRQFATDAADLQETGVEIAMAERHQGLLARLADIGMEWVEALAERIKADPASLGDAALSYSRVAQAIRRTLALEVLTRNGLKDQRLHLSTERKTRQANAKAAREAGQAATVAAKRQKKRTEISDRYRSSTTSRLACMASRT